MACPTYKPHEKGLPYTQSWRQAHHDRGVDVILRRDSVRGEEVDDLVRAEAGVAHAGDDLVDRVLGERDEPVGRDGGGVGAAGEELEAGAAVAVGDTDGTGELDTVT